jgi:hypothetical protein
MVCLSGCKGKHFRPASVPSSAVWVDNTFVDCSVDTQSRTNRCTVYKADTGEILADGLFVLNSSHFAAEKSELHYIAFGERGIYLEDLRILEQLTASQRDPSHRIIDERLKTIASKGGKDVSDCTNVTTPRRNDASAKCALSAFADRRPFYVRYYLQYPNSFGYMGIAGDADGNVYGVQYSSRHVLWGTGDVVDIPPSEGQIFDDDHGYVLPCPKPTILSKAKNGTLTCARPIS